MITIDSKRAALDNPRLCPHCGHEHEDRQTIYGPHIGYLGHVAPKQSLTSPRIVTHEVKCAVCDGEWVLVFDLGDIREAQ